MISVKPMAVVAVLTFAGGVAAQSVVGVVTELRGKIVVVQPSDLPNFESPSRVLVLVTLNPGEGTQPLMQGELGITFGQMGFSLRSIQSVDGRAGWANALKALEKMEKVVMKSRRLLRRMGMAFVAPQPPDGRRRAIFFHQTEDVMRQQPWDRSWYALAEAMVWVRNASDIREAQEGLDDIDKAIREAREEAWKAHTAGKR